MSNIYCWSAAAGAGTGADWTNAYVTLKAAAEAAGTAAGDSIWVAHDHNEANAVATTITSKNSQPNSGTIICVNRAGSVPPVEADLRTTGVVATTGANLLTFNAGTGGTYVYGITLSSGSGAVKVGLTTLGCGTYQNCVFAKPGTAGAANISFGTAGTGTRAIVDNSSFSLGHTGDKIAISTIVLMRNIPTLLLGGIVPVAYLINTFDSRLTCINVDFTQLPAAVAINGNNPYGEVITLVNCKLTAAAVVSGAFQSSAGSLNMINCDSGATNYRVARYHVTGTLTSETTIVRTGGATDGTTPISWKIVTGAGARWVNLFESLPITIWNDTTGAKTVSIYGYWNNAAVPLNDDIWIEADYLNSASFPIGAMANSTKTSFMATGTNIPSDVSVWGGGATTTKFKMSVALTAAMKGPITVRVKAAKASSTFYIDPKIEVV